MRIKRAKVGDLLKIPLDKGQWSYGRVLEDGGMAFYDLATQNDVPIDSIINLPIIFSAILMRYAFNGKTWEIVGHLPLEEALKKPPLFLHVQSDIDSGEYLATTNWDDRIPIDYEIAKTLEVFSIYDPIHIENRLNDHFSERKNIHAEMMRIVK